MSGFVYFHGFGCRQNGGVTAAQKIEADRSLMSGFVYFHGFGCRQNGGMTADTEMGRLARG
jgi:hypothetical protein